MPGPEPLQKTPRARVAGRARTNLFEKQPGMLVTFWCSGLERRSGRGPADRAFLGDGEGPPAHSFMPTRAVRPEATGTERGGFGTANAAPPARRSLSRLRA